MYRDILALIPLCLCLCSATCNDTFAAILACFTTVPALHPVKGKSKFTFMYFKVSFIHFEFNLISVCQLLSYITIRNSLSTSIAQQYTSNMRYCRVPSGSNGIGEGRTI
ncbi:unnamed protein product [Brugia pahangi]|uniref:Secreted protein n=1 Tax=Brugia pahangi TaxID=6280 RepID=A0A0N4SX44_BRUPA|nr:unnamed protein product [Brugia pahangi]